MTINKSQYWAKVKELAGEYMSYLDVKDGELAASIGLEDNLSTCCGRGSFETCVTVLTLTRNKDAFFESGIDIRDLEDTQQVICELALYAMRDDVMDKVYGKKMDKKCKEEGVA